VTIDVSNQRMCDIIDMITNLISHTIFLYFIEKDIT